MRKEGMPIIPDVEVNGKGNIIAVIISCEAVSEMNVVA